MTIENRLRDALHAVDEYEPSPDLFTRVSRSVEEDRAHRRRVLGVVFFVLLAGGLVALFIGTWASNNPAGRLVVPVWVTDVSARFVMVLVLVTLGPSFRRFGRNYVEDIYGAAGSGAEVQRLLDLAFYLVFTGHILGSPVMGSFGDNMLLTTALEESLMRIAAFLAVMGILHSLTLVVLPLSGIVFSWVLWRAALPAGDAGTPPARQAARAAVWAAVALVLAVGIGGILALPNALIGLMDG